MESVIDLRSLNESISNRLQVTRFMMSTGDIPDLMSCTDCNRCKQFNQIQKTSFLVFHFAVLKSSRGLNEKRSMSCSCPNLVSSTCATDQIHFKTIKKDLFKLQVKSLFAGYQLIKKGTARVRHNLEKVRNRLKKIEKNQIQVESLECQESTKTVNIETDKLVKTKSAVEITFNSLHDLDRIYDFNFTNQFYSSHQDELVSVDFSQLKILATKEKRFV